jgi:SOS-response transcriptional repressor LexA
LARTTDTGEKVYNFIVKYQKENKGVPPTHRQIGEAVGVSHKGPVSHHINKLQEKGLVDVDDSGRVCASGGVWLTPEEVSDIRQDVRNYGGDFFKDVSKRFCDIMMRISSTSIVPLLKDKQVIHGEDLETVEEPTYFKPTRYR